MTPNNPTAAHVLDIFTMSIEEKLTALAFQGLANRSGPNVFYRARFWNWPASDDFWMDYLGSRKSLCSSAWRAFPNW